MPNKELTDYIKNQLYNGHKPEHISYLVNEIGGYKLHNDPIITDTNEVFSVTSIDVLKDEMTLAVKGYKSIYDNLLKTKTFK